MRAMEAEPIKVLVAVETVKLENSYRTPVAFDGVKTADGGEAATYPVTLATGGDTTEFALLSSDGNFTVLDIWAE